MKRFIVKTPIKERAQIDARIDNIENYAHFGDYKHLIDELYELRWKNGRRIYFVFLDNTKIVLLMGGNKNDQEKNINRAGTILRKYTYS